MPTTSSTSSSETGAALRRFLVKAAVLAVPLLLWTLAVIAIDPFDYFNVSHIVNHEVKKHNAQEINTLYYHAFQEANAPSAHVLIGDSRTASLPIETINDLTGQRHVLLTASALKVNEITDLFWLAQGYRPLKSVFVGINFSMFNEYAYADRVTGVNEILRNPLRYVFNPNTAEAMYYITKALILKKPAVSSIPPMTRDAFWAYMVRERATDWYGKYKFPSRAFDDMKAMAAFCKAHGIDLTFVIVPHHVEFQNRLWDHHLTKDKVRFLESMLALEIPVIDYDYVNEITLDKANFTDPVHYNDAIGQLIATELTTGQFRIGRRLSPDYVLCISARELGNRRPDALAAFSQVGH